MGRMNISESDKVSAIVEHFKFVSIDDAVDRLNCALKHYKQEKMPKDKYIYWNHQVVDEIFLRMHAKNYIPPILHCFHFAYILKRVCEFFNHDCITINCNPDYLNNSNHRILFDEHFEKYLDASVYNSHYDKSLKKWLPYKYPFLKDIPESVLHIKT